MSNRDISPMSNGTRAAIAPAITSHHSIEIGSVDAMALAEPTIVSSRLRAITLVATTRRLLRATIGTLNTGARDHFIWDFGSRVCHFVARQLINNPSDIGSK